MYNSAMWRTWKVKREYQALFALSILYLGCAMGFAIATPYGEAPDEQLHLRYVEHIVRFGALPPIERHSYSEEAIQPPLYYLLGAALIVLERDAMGEPLHAPIASALPSDPDWHSSIPGALFLPSSAYHLTS